MAATAGAIRRREREGVKHGNTRNEHLRAIMRFAYSRQQKIKKHLKAWNYWRKGNRNSPLHKIAVLFGAYSPSFIGVKAGMDVAELIEKYYRSGGE